MARKKNNKPTVVKKKGNTSAYEKSMCEVVRGLADLDIPKYEVAHRLNISYKQLYTFEKNHKEFALALEYSGFKRNGGGVKSKYDSEYCELVIALSRHEGLLQYQLAERLEIPYSTMMEWKKRYVEFSQALKVSVSACEVWWVEKAKSCLILDKDSKFSAAVWIFLMKNKFGYTDKREEIKKEETQLTITLANSGIEDLKKLKAMNPKDRLKVVGGKG